MRLLDFCQIRSHKRHVICFNFGLPSACNWQLVFPVDLKQLFWKQLNPDKMVTEVTMLGKAKRWFILCYEHWGARLSFCLDLAHLTPVFPICSQWTETKFPRFSFLTAVGFLTWDLTRQTSMIRLRMSIYLKKKWNVITLQFCKDWNMSLSQHICEACGQALSPAERKNIPRTSR